MTIGLSLGDRYGIGPELVARILAEREAGAPPLLVVGDAAVLRRGADNVGVDLDIATVSDPAVPAGRAWALLHRPADAPLAPLGRVTAEAGAEALDTLAALADLAGRGAIQAIVYAPLNKSALKLAGHAAGDELDYLVHHMKPTGDVGEVNILDGLWTSRVTSHIPLRNVADRLTSDAIVRAIDLIALALKGSGRTNPRIAVAALNPHAGENGAFGREEIDVIAPAVRRAAASGHDVTGPLPADTVFPLALRDGYDGIVTMFHDQGQIALKVLGLGKGITLLAGLAVPIATPGHGTAYDIAGKGVARTDGLTAALDLVADMTRREETT